MSTEDDLIKEIEQFIKDDGVLEDSSFTFDDAFKVDLEPTATIVELNERVFNFYFILKAFFI